MGRRDAGAGCAAYASGLTTCDASGFAYVVQMGVCARAVAIERKASPHDDAQATKPTRTGAARIGVAVALYYAFGTAVLGTWDMGIDHPYSNLRMHSGPSNHYFLPLGILHKVPPFAEMWPPRLPWAGGPVLVEAATSAYFLTQGGIPGDVSADLTPRAAALLRRSGHRGLQFFSVAKRFSTTTVANSPWSSDSLDPRAFIPSPSLHLSCADSCRRVRSWLPHLLTRRGYLASATSTSPRQGGARASAPLPMSLRLHPGGAQLLHGGQNRAADSLPCSSHSGVVAPASHHNAYPLPDGDLDTRASFAMAEGTGAGEDGGIGSWAVRMMRVATGGAGWGRNVGALQVLEVSWPRGAASQDDIDTALERAKLEREDGKEKDKENVRCLKIGRDTWRRRRRHAHPPTPAIACSRVVR